MQVGKSEKTLDASTAKLAEQALATILSTDKFESSPQMSAFLRYVVEQTINGNQSRIKAFSVAVDALGKPNSFDPQNDPVVRVLAGRLRAALDTYAEEHPNVPLVISMRKGSYIPLFSGPAIDDDSGEKSGAGVQAPQRAFSNDPIKTDYAGHGISAASSSYAKTPPARHTSHMAIRDSVARGTEGTSRSQNRFGTQANPAGTWKTRWTIAMVLFGVFGFLQFTDFKKSSEPDLKAASLVSSGTSNYRNSVKPDMPCLYISAVSSGDAFEDRLNTFVSGALASHNDIVVHRILKIDGDEQYWQEDYILSLVPLNLQGESHINIQLISAMTGRVIHSKPVVLEAQAVQQLSSASLANIIEAAELAVAANGPLFEHFHSDPTQR